MDNKSISKQIAERLKQRLGEKIISDKPFPKDDNTFNPFPEKKEDTILNFLIDATLEDAIKHPNIDKLIKINKLAEGKEEWKPVGAD